MKAEIKKDNLLWDHFIRKHGMSRTGTVVQQSKDQITLHMDNPGTWGSTMIMLPGEITLKGDNEG